MTWVRRRADQRQPHPCNMPDAFSDIGDLWRCDGCDQLWRGDYRCATCRRIGYAHPHDGQHQPGHIWVHASRWQRLRYWRAGRDPLLDQLERERWMDRSPSRYRSRRPEWSMAPAPHQAGRDEAS